MTNQQLIQTEKAQEVVAIDVNAIVAVCHDLACEAGWWGKLAQVGPGFADPTAKDVAEKLLLIHCEISEAVEGRRKNLMDDHLPDLPMFDVELADAAIRLFDLAGAMRINLGVCIARKLAYNAKRKDHTPEHRAAKGGKKF